MNTDNIDLSLLRTAVRHINSQPSEQGEKPEINEKEKAAVQLNTEKLKLIDEISRLILELKTRSPELAQSLSKSRDNVSLSQENIPVKKLISMLSTIQQNLNSITDKSVETIKNTVIEIAKILQPKNAEMPQENKLILALSKNDFATANNAIKNIVQTAVQQSPQSLPQQQPQQPQSSQPLQQPQPTQSLQQPQPMQPLQQPQPTQPLPTQQSQQPQPTQPSQPSQQLQPTQSLQPSQPSQPIQPIQPSQFSPSQPQLSPSPQTYHVIFNAIQELKELGIPREFQNAPLKELEAIIIQKTGIEIPKETAKELSAIFNEKPTFADIKIDLKSETFSIKDACITPRASELLFSDNRIKGIEIPTLKDFPMQNLFPQKEQWIAFSLYQLTKDNSSMSQFFLQPWLASPFISSEKAECNFWQNTQLPLTPQIQNIKETILSFGKLPENPEMVKLFANGMHELSLQTENGKPITKEQENLLWRVINNDQFNNTQLTSENSQLARTQLSQILSTSFLKYQPQGNFEGELFKNLPEPIKKELSRELPTGKAWQPETLQKAVEKVLEKHIEQQQQQQNNANVNEQVKKAHEDIRQILQNFKEQIQWTRIDQDTRTSTDRENVFYFMHEGELQKGRLKIKDDRKGGKKQQDSSISFTIETKTKNLGNVHADLTLSNNILNINLQDEVGTASEAVNEERETLAKELADIGISLGQLLYGKTPKVQTISITEKKEKTSNLDLKA